MPRFLAIEWNDLEARLAVASSRGGRVVIDQAFSVALRADHAEADSAEVNVGERIAAALAARGVRRVDSTLVAIGRTNVELRQLSVPPAPDAELPDLVRFQALREFASLGEDWPLDFIMLDETPEEAVAVLAAAVDPELVEQMSQTCRTAGLKTNRLVLRPCAAASLLCRSKMSQRAEVRLLVDLLMDEADLTVMIDRKTIFLRCTRLPGDPLTDPSSAQALLAEIRRTLAAAQNQLGGRRAESIVLCGSGPEHKVLAEAIESELGITTDLFDPFDELTLDAHLERALPDHPGRFTPLLGMLLDELDHTPHAFDFLHPRKRPKPVSQRNLYGVGGLVAALIVVALISYGLWKQNSLGKEIKVLNAQSVKLDKQLVPADAALKGVEAIDEWSASDVVWLDELHWLSRKFPPAKDAMLTKFTASASSRGAAMVIDGLVRDVDVFNAMESGLRDQSHQMSGEGKTEDSSEESYGWKFSSSVHVAPEEL